MNQDQSIELHHLDDGARPDGAWFLFRFVQLCETFTRKRHIF